MGVNRTIKKMAIHMWLLIKALGDFRQLPCNLAKEVASAMSQSVNRCGSETSISVDGVRKVYSTKTFIFDANFMQMAVHIGFELFTMLSERKKRR